MDYIIIAAIAAYIGWRANDIMTRIMINSIMEDMGITKEQRDKIAEHCADEIKKAREEQQEELSVKLEQHQGVIYAYSEDDGTFLGQGKDREELFKNLGDRFKNLRCVVKKENGADLLKSNA